MRATDPRPAITPNSGGVAKSQFWRRSALPDVEVLEHRDSASHRGLTTTYAFALQPAAVPGSVYYRGRTHDAPPGVVMLSEPGETFKISGPSSGMILFVSPNLMSQVALEHFGHVKPVHWRTVLVQRPALSEELLATIGTLRNGCDLAAEAVASRFIASCITQFGEPTRQAVSSGGPKVTLARARDILHSSYREPVTLEDLRLASGATTKQQLIRSFKAAFGLTPHRYLTHLRLGLARQLLRCGHDCREAAHAVGFYDQSQMNRHFLRHYRTTPGAYAKSVVRGRACNHSDGGGLSTGAFCSCP
jgi:AraC-like DNA-binding protein